MRWRSAVARCLCALGFMVLVFFVPSSASWADTEPPASSDSSSLSDGQEPGSPEPPSPSPSESPSGQQTEPLSEQPTESPDSTPSGADVAPLSEPCGTEQSPCMVALPVGLVALLVLIGGLSVLTTGAVMVSTWGR